jgi:hypothetical protein
MTKNTKLKIAAGAATVGAAVLGGLTLGPIGAAGVGLAALGQFLIGLYHTAPPPPRQLKLPLDAPPPQ